MAIPLRFPFKTIAQANTATHAIGDVAKLIKTYLPYAASAEVRELLSPYRGARFQEPWLFRLPDIAPLISQICQAVAEMRAKNEEVQTPRSLAQLLIEELERSHNPPPGTYTPLSRREVRKIKQEMRETHVYFQTSLLDDFESFISSRAEGALVCLVLLTTVNTGTNWGQVPSYGQYWRDFEESEKYRGCCVLGFPQLTRSDRKQPIHPFEVLQTLCRLSGASLRADVPGNWRKYYWMANGDNPYERVLTRPQIRGGYIPAPFTGSAHLLAHLLPGSCLSITKLLVQKERHQQWYRYGSVETPGDTV